MYTVDEMTDAAGFWTIRLSDGSANGNTDAQPVATAYTESDARAIADALNERERITAENTA